MSFKNRVIQKNITFHLLCIEISSVLADLIFSSRLSAEGAVTVLFLLYDVPSLFNYPCIGKIFQSSEIVIQLTHASKGEFL